MTLGTTIRRLGITFVLAVVLAFLLIIVVPDRLLVLLFAILWRALFLGWPNLSRWLAFIKFPKVPAPPRPRPPAPKARSGCACSAAHS